MNLTFRKALPEDAPDCLHLRGQTRQNAFTPEQLAALGITAQTWEAGIRDGTIAGHVCLEAARLVGMAFHDARSGEVLVVAVLPDYEGLGIGKRLLERVLMDIEATGFPGAFLGCNPDPFSRSHGFYRHLGWTPTGRFDGLGDEILERSFLARPVSPPPLEDVPTPPNSTQDIPRFGLILKTSRKAECVRFYRDLLRREPILETDFLCCFAYEGGYLMIEPSAGLESGTPETLVIRLHAQDLRQEEQHLKAIGVPAQAHRFDWGEILVLQDPAGNRIEFKDIASFERQVRAFQATSKG